MKRSTRHAITPTDQGLDLPPGPHWRYTPPRQNPDGTVEIDAMQLVWAAQHRLHTSSTKPKE